MKNTCKFVTGTISALIAVGSLANATTVIDFEGEVEAGARNGRNVYQGVRANPEENDPTPNHYTHDGFTFTATYRDSDYDRVHGQNENLSISVPVAIISDPSHEGTPMVGNPNAWYGFHDEEVTTLITITSAALTFSLHSIDLGPEYAGSDDEANYRIEAFNASGLVATVIFEGEINHITTQTTKYFNPLVWKDLTRVEIQGYGNTPNVGIDNVVFNMGTEAVPEPSSALLVGLAAFGFAVRRRRN